MEDFTRHSGREFVALLASAAPVPGGGGAAALVGAIGTALGSMVGSLTAGKKKYAQVEEEIRALMKKCETLEGELLDQVAADAKGFAPLAAAYRLAKDVPGRALILEMQSCNTAAFAFYRAQGYHLAGFDSCCYTNSDIARKEVRLDLAWFPEDWEGKTKRFDSESNS